MLTRPLCIYTLAALVASTGAAPAAASKGPGEWDYFLSTASVRMPEIDLDTGGETGQTSHHLRAGAERRVGDATALGARLYYDFFDRDFSGTAGFGALGPWEETQRFGVAGSINRRTGFGLSYGVSPFVNWSYESGAFSEDAMSYGAALAVVGGLSRDKRIGVGARVYRNIDDSTKVTPIIIIDWEINDDWTLSNPREANFTVPAGLEISYRSGENWRIAAAGIYHSEEFRLDGRGVAPGGIGESTGILSYLRVTRRWSSWLKLNGYLGAMINGEFQVEDAAGDKLASSHYDTAPFAAVSLEGNF